MLKLSYQITDSHLMMQSVGKIEEELKQLGSRYSEKKQQLIGLQRKKG